MKKVFPFAHIPVPVTTASFAPYAQQTITTNLALSASYALFGPSGSQGPTGSCILVSGSQGPQGAAGAAGAPGSVFGPVAYTFPTTTTTTTTTTTAPCLSVGQPCIFAGECCSFICTEAGICGELE